MMTLDEIRALVGAITYKPGWSFRVEDEGGRPFVQAEVSTVSDLTMDPTGKTSARTPWRSGKRYLSPHMCRQEVVGTVLDLIKAAEMHEVHEWFRYRGASIYNPHLDPDVLVTVARKASSFVTRDNAMSMAEAAPTILWEETRGDGPAMVAALDPAKAGGDTTAGAMIAADWSLSCGRGGPCSFPHCDCGRD